MLEQEARTKWCSFVHTGLAAGLAVDRNVADAVKCCTSHCMMWRQINPTHQVHAHGGYCGLAGKEDA